MQLNPQIPYHPTLKILVKTWLTQKQTQRSLNFLLHVGVYHQDVILSDWALKNGANIDAKPESWYSRFLGNLKSTS